MTNRYRDPVEVEKRKEKLREVADKHSYLTESDYQKGIISKVGNFSKNRPTIDINKVTGIPTTNAGRKLEGLETLTELEPVVCDKCAVLTTKLKRIPLDLGKGMIIQYHCDNCLLCKNENLK